MLHHGKEVNTRRSQLFSRPVPNPAPVAADALGYHDKTTTRLRNEAGGIWSRYAAGDHSQSPAGWVPRGTGDS